MTSSIEIDIAIPDTRWETAFPELEVLARDTVLRTLTSAGIAHETEISLSFVDDNAIQELNREYRGKDKPTNVLSFPQNEPSMLGDVVMAYETVLREAEEQKKSVSEHLKHLLVHGVLHLLGYDHENEEDAATMEGLEIRILNDMDIKNPYETE